MSGSYKPGRGNKNGNVLVGLYPWQCSHQCGMSRLPLLSGISKSKRCYTGVESECLQGATTAPVCSPRDLGVQRRQDRPCEYTGRSPNIGGLITLAGPDWRQGGGEAEGSREILSWFQEARRASQILFSKSPSRGKPDIASASCTFVLCCFCLFSHKCLFLLLFMYMWVFLINCVC